MARLLWLLPVGLLQACAGTPVAEQLERSFAVPEDRPVQEAVPISAAKTSSTVDRPAVAAPETASPPASSSTTPTVSDGDAKNQQEPLPEPETKAQTAIAQPQPKAPYRITIRVAGADPAAPAEAVTRALRNAEVGFAVERIERVEP